MVQYGPDEVSHAHAQWEISTEQSHYKAFARLQTFSGRWSSKNCVNCNEGRQIGAQSGSSNKQLLEAVRGGAIEKGQQLDAGQVDYLMSQIIQVAKDLDFDVGEKFYQ